MVVLPMSEHGQFESLAALYMAVIGTVAMVEYLTGFDVLTQLVGLQEPWLTILYLGWFVALAKATPERWEAAFGA